MKLKKYKKLNNNFKNIPMKNKKINNYMSNNKNNSKSCKIKNNKINNKFNNNKL